MHAWAAWRVYKIEKKRVGRGDRVFLERVFQKLLLNFTWWVNRKDAEGNNVFQGGFLGLDNIGVFDRSTALPTGGHLEQSDGTSWMGMYCLNMLAIAMELAADNPAYEDVASKFWEHFLYIAHAMNTIGDEGGGLWDEEDGFFYDVLNLPDGSRHPLKIRSMVGLIPLFAVETLDADALDRLPAFKRRLEWFIEHRPDLTAARREHEDPRQRQPPAAGRGVAASSAPRPERTCWTRRSSSRRTASARCRASTEATRTCSASTGTSIASTTSPPNRRPACLAATRTGAGRCGSRSTSC